jgi:hypothetical protein
LSFEESCLPTFAAHQTFHPRFGWLKKGVDAVRHDPKAFASDSATITLGVGKNMVDAVKYWSLAFKLIEDRDGVLCPTGFANTFLGTSGLDPYLEDVSTLWLLHLRLLQDKCIAPVWWLFFNEFSHATFSQKRLSDTVAAEVLDSTIPKQPNRSSIDKDVDALIRMYSLKSKKARQSIEDVLDSPFRELGILIPNEVGESNFRFVFGKKPTLTGFVVQYACLDFMTRNNLSSSTVSLARLVSDENAPGRLLKIDSETLKTYIEEFNLEGITISSAAGSLQMTLSKPIDELLSSAIERHYTSQVTK